MAKTGLLPPCVLARAGRGDAIRDRRWPRGPPRPSPTDGPGQVVSPSGIGGDQGLLTPLEWGAHQAAHPVFLAWMTFKSQGMSQETPNSQLVLKNETGPALLQDEPWVGLPHEESRVCTVPRDPHRPLGDDRRLWPPSPSEPSSPERDHVTSPVSASASLQQKRAGKTRPRTTTGPGAPLHHALSLSRPRPVWHQGPGLL